jgi:hypothetical protein
MSLMLKVMNLVDIIFRQLFRNGAGRRFLPVIDQQQFPMFIKLRP